MGINLSSLLTPLTNAATSFGQGTQQGQDRNLAQAIQLAGIKRQQEQDALAQKLGAANLAHTQALTDAAKSGQWGNAFPGEDEQGPGLFQEHKQTGEVRRVRVGGQPSAPSAADETVEPIAPTNEQGEPVQQAPTDPLKKALAANAPSQGSAVRPFVKPVPPKAVPLSDKMQTRIQELTTGGMALAKASEQARSEFGQAPPATNFAFPTVEGPNGPTVARANTKSGDIELTDVAGKPASGGRSTASINKMIAANTSQLSVLDDALKELDNHPSAVGLSRGVPIIGDALNQRVDPGGVAARAQIANIGSMVIHDRSGAAVTVHEMPRLAPFIPAMTDKPETIRIKLQKLRAAIAVETGALQSPPQGGGGGRAGGAGTHTVTVNGRTFHVPD